MRQTPVPYMLLRGGSSKGVFFRSSDLPNESKLQENVLKWAMGAHGDSRQIDGLGGANPLTSKIAVVSPSFHKGCDVDYNFIQALVGEDRLDDSPNCGNILAAVGAFAIESGLLSVEDGTANVSVFMKNSQKRCDLSFVVQDGLPIYEGNTEIDGVMGTAAPVACQYHDLAGSLCKRMIPTGHLSNVFDGIRSTCIDNGMPVVCLRAEDFGLSGIETPDNLNKNIELKERLEIIRQKAGYAMGLGSVANKSVPKICLVSPPRTGGAMCTRTFIPNVCHQAIGVLGAITVATAALFEDSLQCDWHSW